MPPARWPEMMTPSSAPEGAVCGNGLSRPDVDPGEQLATVHALQQCVVVGHSGPTDQNQPSFVGQQVEIGGIEQVLAFGGRGGEHEDELASLQRLLQGGGAEAGVTQDGGGQPGIVDPDGGVERDQERMQGSADVAVAEDADGRVPQKDGIVIAVGHVSLAAVSGGAVLAADAARQIEGEGKGKLSHCL